MKKTICFLLITSFCIAMAGCKTKIVHCDNCNKEVVIKESSNMEESWIIYCDACNEELFGDDPLLGGN